MVGISRLLNIRSFALLLFSAIFVICLVVCYVLVNVWINALELHKLRVGFEVALPSIMALSVSLVVFPFVSVPAVESITARAEKAGIKVNPKLLKDYIDGCFTIFLLSTAEIILIIVYQIIGEIAGNIVVFALPMKTLILCGLLSLLCTLIVILVLVILALWEATSLLQGLITGASDD